MSEPGPAPASAKPTGPSGWRNWISIAGAVVASGSFFAFLLLFTLDMSGKDRGNPYLGILCYVVAPFFLAVGIAVALFGLWRQRRENARLHGEGLPARLNIDLSRTRDRRILTLFVSGAFVYLALTAIGSYQTYVYTESDSFCGMVCHSVMGPELTAYQRNPHARVACVECHVGEGAKSYISAKLNGVHQLIGITFNRYPRPIPVPIHNLRPARDTCERCHWPEKFSGTEDLTIARYLADDANSPYAVRLLLKIGGSGAAHGKPGGIHMHSSLDTKVEYFASDAMRQVIPWVRVTDNTGAVTVYRSKGFKGDPDPPQIRQMDCIDCHNRPAHRYSSPNDSIDEAIYLGRIDRSLPAIKRTVVDLLSQPYPSKEAGVSSISGALRKKYAGAQAIDATVETVLTVYRGNFFPEMKVDWSKYPDNKGHLDFPGCFRCHDEKHVTAGGQHMPATKCDSCHIILAQGSGAELAKLSSAGFDYKHPSTDIEGLDLTCSDCHNGKNQEN